MKAFDQGAFYRVTVSPQEMSNFASRWPCSGMRNPKRGMAFTFDKKNGDLVDISGENEEYDGSAVAALSENAQTYGKKTLGLK